MKDYNCICEHCAFSDCCPSAYFPPNMTKCADLRDMRNKGGKAAEKALAEVRERG